MNTIKCLVLSLITALLANVVAMAQAAPPATAVNSGTVNQTDTVITQLHELLDKIRAKMKTGDTAETNYTAELKSCDELVAKNPQAKPDDLAQIVLLKAMLYLEVFEQPDKGTELLKKIKTDYPTSSIAGRVDMMLDQIAKQSAAKKIQDSLKAGAVFPDFNVKSLDGKPLSVSGLKGKIVLVDFWATWCPPCRAELPNVIKTYEKYHSQGFDIIGVSLDTDRDKLESFLKKQGGMTWPQYFDGKGWSNDLAKKYGVEAIPFTILIGPDGKIIGTNLSGDQLVEAVGQALDKK